MNVDNGQKGNMTLDDYQIGERIRTVRKRRGMTQEQLAEAANLSVPYISHLERGFKRPSLETLVRLAGVAPARPRTRPPS